jgi:hypothetical protein
VQQYHETGMPAVHPVQPALDAESRFDDVRVALSSLLQEITAYDEAVKDMQAARTREYQAREQLASKLDQTMPVQRFPWINS